MNVMSFNVRSYRFSLIVGFLLLFSHHLAFSQDQADEIASQKQKDENPSILSLDRSVKVAEHAYPERTNPQHATPETKSSLEGILHMDPYEKLFQQAIDRRLDELRIEEEVEVFGISYFAMRNVATTGGFVRTRFITPDYRLGPGDEIVVNLTGVQDQTLRLLVSNFGTVSIPEYGPVFVWGKTLVEVSARLREIIQSLYRNINVEVDISKPRAIGVYITGEVVKPGAYQLTGISTVLDLLYLCGGPTQRGSFRQIVVSRMSKFQPAEARVREVSPQAVEKIVVDLYDIFLKGTEETNVILQLGDRIVVPPVGPTVALKGAVKRPSRYEFVADLTLEELIALGGGFLPGANTSRIMIRRKNKFGFVKFLEVDFNQEAEGKSFAIADGDEVLVSPGVEFLQAVVVISGNVSYPGQYAFTEGMKLSELIEKAGGCLPGTYRERVNILRFVSFDRREVIQASLAENLLPEADTDIALEQWDIVKVYTETDIEPLPVGAVEGEITNPGLYPIRENMRVQDLIVAAGGLTHLANARRAELLRITEDEQTIKLEVDLAQIRSDPSGPANFPIQNDDKLIILKREDMYALNEVIIKGEVNQPGKYKIAQGESLRSLILKAGGLTGNAYLLTAELTRYGDDGKVEVLQVELDKCLNDPGKQERIVLQNRDHIRIYWDPMRMKTITVNIAGQVEIPGTYTLLKGARLSEALRRAGGIRPEGYKYGIIMVRKSLQQIEKAVIGEIQQAQERELLRLQAALVESAVTNDEKQLQLRIAEMRKRIITLLGERRIQGRFIFDPNTDDPVLEDGDTITVPILPRWVMIVGAVYGSGSLIYKEGTSAEEYIQKVGGVTPYANEDQIYVIKPNGVVKQGRDRLDPITPGDVIIIPPKLESYPFQFASEQKPDEAG